MESIMPILLIPIFFFLCFVIFWLLRFWIGAFVPDNTNMSVSKKILYTILGIIGFVFLPPITFTNIAILLCICIVIILIIKYATPVLYIKTICFIKKYNNDIIAILFCLVLFALIGFVL